MVERLLFYGSVAGFGWLTALTLYYAVLKKRRAVVSMVASFGVAGVVTVWTAVVFLVVAGVVHYVYGSPSMTWGTLFNIVIAAYVVSVAELTLFFVFNQWIVRRLVRRYRALTDINLTRELADRLDINSLSERFDIGRIEVLVVDDLEANAHTMVLARPSLFSPNLGREVLVIKRPLVEMLDDDELEAVLAHEFAHIEELDTRFRPYFEVLARVYSFDPFARYVCRYVRRLQEYGADDRAVEVTGKSEALARALVKVAEHERDADRSRFEVKERAERLVGSDKQDTCRVEA
ncbi:MAG: M56 family metallopeptidase [Halobacteriales archaeon]|nr:M56 family metallopeptidase [Halobacteriales archaeon]